MREHLQIHWLQTAGLNLDEYFLESKEAWSLPSVTDT